VASRAARRFLRAPRGKKEKRLNALKAEIIIRICFYFPMEFPSKSSPQEDIGRIYDPPQKNHSSTLSSP